MKVAILTLPISTNYGGILQAYALQTVLERLGHKVTVWDTPKRQTLPLWKRPLAYFKRFILKYIFRQPTVVFYEEHYNKSYPIISKFVMKFISQHINRKEVDFRKLRGLERDGYEAIIVGSDQVWRPRYFPSAIENAYLSFAKGWNIKRISYAASFGTDEWEYSWLKTKRCSRLLKDFDCVTVRELQGVDLCLKNFNMKATWVLDPTLLLSSEDYLRLAKIDSVPANSGKLFCYILDQNQEKTQLIDKIARDKGLTPVFMTVEKMVDNDVCPQPPVEDWLRGIIEAQFVFTDSFHACVFSIIFNKPFIVFGNSERGMSRFTSLLTALKLEKRLIYSNNDYPPSDEISYRVINKFIDEKRKEAIMLLKNNLS